MEGAKGPAFDKNPEKFIEKSIAILVLKNLSNRRKFGDEKYWMPLWSRVVSWYLR